MEKPVFLNVLHVEEITQCVMASGLSPLMSDTSIPWDQCVTGPLQLTAPMEAVRTMYPDLSAAVMRNVPMDVLAPTVLITSNASTMNIVNAPWMLTVTTLMRSATCLLHIHLRTVPTVWMLNVKEVC